MGGYNRDTILVEDGARARSQDGELARPVHRTPPLRPRAAYGDSAEVSLRTGKPLRHGSLRRGRTLLGIRGNPLSTRWRKFNTKFSMAQG